MHNFGLRCRVEECFTQTLRENAFPWKTPLAFLTCPCYRTVERKKIRIQSVLARAPRKFSIATDRALDAWEHSGKRIVRCEQEDSRLVGLLLHVE